MFNARSNLGTGEKAMFARGPDIINKQLLGLLMKKCIYGLYVL